MTCSITAFPAASVAAGVSAQEPGNAAAEGRMVLVMDSSGSMKEKVAGGGAKIDAAKSALQTVVAGLPADAQVGLRVYGAEVFSADDPGACEDSELEVPIGGDNRAELTDAIDSYEPYGETPIGYALEQAANDLGNEGQRTIVLVSDGEATCAPDPCEVAADIAERGIDLKVDVVGLDVSGEAREQLQCVADQGNGTYVDADDADELASGMARASTRAFRPFSVMGTPIEGTTDTAGAPELASGQYTDTLGSAEDDDAVKYYRVPRSIDGSTLHLSVTARPTYLGDLATDAMRLGLTTLDGEECWNNQEATVDHGGKRDLLTSALALNPDNGDDVISDEACAGQSEYLLKVDRRDSDPESGRTDIELRYTEEPPVTDVGELPGPVEADDLTERAVAEQEPSGSVVGGASFNDAPELTEGTVTDSIRPGELLVYKVKADWGQSPAVSFRAKDSAYDGITGLETFAYAPDRSLLRTPIMPGNRASAYDGDEELYDLVLPEVRYRNREGGYAERGLSQAGFYYVGIMLSDDDEPAWELPLTISTELSGEPSGAPTYVDAAATGHEPGDPADPGETADPAAPGGAGEETAQASDESGSTGWLLAAGVAGALLVAGGVIAAVALRRRT